MRAVTLRTELVIVLKKPREIISDAAFFGVEFVNFFTASRKLNPKLRGPVLVRVVQIW